jgi:hypothetical protein
VGRRRGSEKLLAQPPDPPTAATAPLGVPYAGQLARAELAESRRAPRRLLFLQMLAARNATTTRDKRDTEDAVLSSDIEQLPDLSGGL